MPSDGEVDLGRRDQNDALCASDGGLEAHLVVQVVAEHRRRRPEDHLSSKAVGGEGQAGSEIQCNRGSSYAPGKQRDGTVMAVEEHNATLADTHSDARGLCAHEESEALGARVT